MRNKFSLNNTERRTIIGLEWMDNKVQILLRRFDCPDRGSVTAKDLRPAASTILFLHRLRRLDRVSSAVDLACTARADMDRARAIRAE
jgi:hypothetical protein